MDNDQLLTRAVAKALPAGLAKKKLASGEKLRIYWGIDPTGGRIHIGHSVPLRKMQQFAEAGHHVTLLIGSFTAMIGDPSDKDALRKRLTRDDVQKNFESYKEQAAKILDFSKIEIRYNHEWLEKLTFEEVVELASHFTVQQMLERDNFEKRIKSGKPVHIHEFMYPLMVGYDSVVLDVDCEIGGTDQEFNMLAGRTLQTAFGKRDKFVLTTKLIEGTDGRLMSKTYDNCVYINDAPGDMFGKILSMKDELITLYMECCTDIPESEIAATEKAMKKGENPKDFKVRLAKEIVTMYHSAEDATKAAEEFDNVHRNKQLPTIHSHESIEEILDRDFDQELHSSAIRNVNLYDDIKIIDIMIMSKMVSSTSDARRVIKQGGVSLNGKKVNSIDALAEVGILMIGSKRSLQINHYAHSRIHCDSGGSLHMEIIPLKKNFSRKERELAISEAIPGAVLFMFRKGYLKNSEILIEPEFLLDHFNKLLNKSLIRYQVNKRGSIDVDMYLPSYLQNLNDVEHYAKLRDMAFKQIMEMDEQDRMSMLSVIKCPNCEAKMNFYYNKHTDENFNANGYCSKCEFRFNDRAPTFSND